MPIKQNNINLNGIHLFLNTIFWIGYVIKYEFIYWDKSHHI